MVVLRMQTSLRQEGSATILGAPYDVSTGTKLSSNGNLRLRVRVPYTLFLLG